MQFGLVFLCTFFFFYCDLVGAKFLLQSFVITLGLYLLITGKTTKQKSSRVPNLRVITCGFLTFASFPWGLCPPVPDTKLPPSDAGGFKLLGRDSLPIWRMNYKESPCFPERFFVQYQDRVPWQQNYMLIENHHLLSVAKLQ